MCIIIVRRKGTPPVSQEFLERAKARNPHGFGYAYWDGEANVVHYLKQRAMHNCIDSFRELEKQDREFIFHTRYSTHGEVNNENAHPFLVNGGGLVFHNGKMDKMEEWNKKMSDTWHYCEKVEARMKRNRWLTFEDAVEHYNERHLGESRLATIELTEGKITTYGEIVPESSLDTSSWVEIGGNLFSNRYSIQERKVSNAYTYTGSEWYRGGTTTPFTPEQVVRRFATGWSIDMEDLLVLDKEVLTRMLEVAPHRVARTLVKGRMGWEFGTLSLATQDLLKGDK